MECSIYYVMLVKCCRRWFTVTQDFHIPISNSNKRVIASCTAPVQNTNYLHCVEFQGNQIDHNNGRKDIPDRARRKLHRWGERTGNNTAIRTAADTDAVFTFIRPFFFPLNIVDKNKAWHIFETFGNVHRKCSIIILWQRNVMPGSEIYVVWNRYK